MQIKKDKIIVILGPTATGKSDLAVDVALHLKQNCNIEAEIISVDSRQVYTGLDLGTGKITRAEMRGVTHHLLDIIDPQKTMSVADFQVHAKYKIKEILERKHLPILVGGTGFYIDAIVHDISLPEVKPDQNLRNDLEQKDIQFILEKFNTLCELHNITKHKVDITNKRRLIRAIEIILQLGYIPDIQPKDIYDAYYIGLDMADEILIEKIKTRIQKRLDAGMIEESIQLLKCKKLTHERMQKLGLEYAFISDYLQDKLAMDEFKEKLFFAIWHYVKRQRTWFRKNTSISWFTPECRSEIYAEVDLFLNEPFAH